MTPEAAALFTSVREYLLFSLLILLLAAVSLAFEYNNYKRLTNFDDAIVKATVLVQYTKHKNDKTYQVLKLRLENGPSFYTTAELNIRDLSGYNVSLWIKTDRIGFLDYLKGFFTYSHIESAERLPLWRYQLSNHIASVHQDRIIQETYSALFTAIPMGKELRVTLSALGISHLLAISGFHLGVLSMLLFALLRLPYRWLQERYFPFRHGKRDLFIIVALLLAVYVLFLGMPPSLLRSFAMLLIGYLLYDRGLKIISMQTLLLTLLLLIALWPRLFFNMGFWLSVSGVFYIFLFLIHFSGWSKRLQFIGIHIWVYGMMLPIALSIFGIFSLLHPLSIVATIGFVIFYPLTIFLHIIGLGALLDPALISLLKGSVEAEQVRLFDGAIVLHLLLSLLSIRYRSVLWMLMGFSVTVLVSAVYQIT